MDFDLRGEDKRTPGGNFSYPSSAVAVVFVGHLSARSRLTGIDPDTSGQSAPACSFLRQTVQKLSQLLIS